MMLQRGIELSSLDVTYVPPARTLISLGGLVQVAANLVSESARLLASRVCWLTCGLCRYVSSLSLYILCLFGLRGVLTVALGPNDGATTHPPARLAVSHLCLCAILLQHRSSTMSSCLFTQFLCVCEFADSHPSVLCSPLDADDTKIMQQQMTGGMNAQAQDMKKVYPSSSSHQP